MPLDRPTDGLVYLLTKTYPINGINGTKIAALKQAQSDHGSRLKFTFDHRISCRHIHISVIVGQD